MERDQQIIPAQTSASNSSVPNFLIGLTDEAHTPLQQRSYEDRFRTLALATTDLLWITNIDGTAKEADPTWYTFTGQEDTHFTGWHWLNTIHIDDQERIEEIWKKAITAQQSCEAECRIRRSDGIYRICKVQGVPVRGTDGSICEWIGMGTDITKHKQVEEQIEQQARTEMQARLTMLQQILDELPGSVYLVQGRDARLVLANRATATVWGASWTIGQPEGDFLAQHGITISGTDGRPLPLEQLATLRTVRYGGIVRHHQEIIHRPDGTTLPTLVNAVAFDLHNLKIFSSETPTDITQRSEPAAIVVQQDLTALKEAERLKDEFIGIAAHELRNPLTTLKGYTDALLTYIARGRGPELSAWQMKALQSINQAILRLVELSDDLLDVTRLQAGQLALHIKPTDLIPLIKNVATRLQMTTEQHDIQVITLLDSLIVDIDPRRIEQVLHNLIGNAIKYSPAGGPIIITIRQEGKAKRALLSIHDDGIGIPEQQQAHIFSRFMRADNVHTHGISGTGLGLYLCRGLVERHGGHIWFGSSEGQGTTFFLALPISSATPPES